MSRLLEALRQIEAKSPPPPPGAARGASDRGGEDRRNDTPPLVPSEEADLAPAEQAAAELPGELARLPGPQQTPPEQTPREQTPSEQPARQQPAVAAFGQTQRPPGPSPPETSHTAADGVPSATAEHARPYAELADRICAQLPTDRSSVLMFTSAGDGEGKTQVVVGLAAALAERIEGEVLVADANLHSPAVARSFAMQAEQGLADVLRQKADWQPLVRTTAIPRVSILPWGAPCPPSEPPNQRGLGPLLRELRGRYRLVLLDTASLAHEETAPVSRHCEGVYLVVRLRHATWWAVRRALRTIEAGGGRLLGSVVTGA